jgi:hypothetical protein
MSLITTALTSTSDSHYFKCCILETHDSSTTFINLTTNFLNVLVMYAWFFFATTSTSTSDSFYLNCYIIETNSLPTSRDNLTIAFIGIVGLVSMFHLATMPTSTYDLCYPNFGKIEMHGSSNHVNLTNTSVDMLGSPPCSWSVPHRHPLPIALL